MRLHFLSSPILFSSSTAAKRSQPRETTQTAACDGQQGSLGVEGENVGPQTMPAYLGQNARVQEPTLDFQMDLQKLSLGITFACTSLGKEHCHSLATESTMGSSVETAVFAVESN